jgi:hypothetical protein
MQPHPPPEAALQPVAGCALPQPQSSVQGLSAVQAQSVPQSQFSLHEQVMSHPHPSEH